MVKNPSPETIQTYIELSQGAAEETAEYERLTAEAMTHRDRAAEWLGAAKSLETVYPSLLGQQVIQIAGIAPNVKFGVLGGVGGLSGKDAVWKFFSENRGDWFTISDVVGQVVRLGWVDGTEEENENRVRHATLRLVQQEKLDTARGSGRAHFYRLPPEPGDDEGEAF